MPRWRPSSGSSTQKSAGNRTGRSGWRSCCHRSRRWSWPSSSTSDAARRSARAWRRRGSGSTGDGTPRSRRMNAQHEESGITPAMWKTAVFLLGGLGMLAAGWLAQPRFVSTRIESETQQVLFPELSDAGKAASLEIVKYDESMATLQPFKVVQSGGVWVLPSHQNYPADARDHLAAAATAMVDLKPLDVVSTSPAEHETYGVIEPDPDKIKPGMTGVGELVEIRDAGGGKLARLVIGKEDRRPAGADGAARTLRFVRKAGQDPVYRVDIDTSRFTTRFDDWIEKDLLKLSPWDVRRLTLDDYTLGAVESGGRIRVEQNRKSRIELQYDDKQGAWKLDKLEAFAAGNKPTEEKLADGEELASGRLNDLRNALGDLKIVDVVRKPAGLSGELRAEEKFTNDPEAVASMQQRGFLPLKSGEILSTDGETIVGMKDGVEYLLRFGAGTTVAAGGSQAGKKAGGGEAADEDASEETTGRYLLVMARFNEGLLEKPVLDPLPAVPDAQEKDTAQQGDKGEDPKANGEKSEGDKAGGEAAEALKKAEEAEAKAQAALEERRRVERENRRRQDEYDDRVKAAQKRVRELNGRFADWYYVVSEKEYAKIHLDRAGVVQKKEKQPDADGPKQP
ncbi:MAG: DUF4340 domain-containing protein [Planctomycetia bacterium]|nr:DUF4340 domain-containing protein [Planctomycetia bacterium]